MRRFLRSIVRRGLTSIGFELRRRPAGHVWGADPFADQREILRGTDVRTVFDVGANRGQTTSKYRELFPAADIHAFEPFPESFAQLQRTHADAPLVHPHQVAVADHAGRRTFHANESHYTNSLLPPAADAARVVGPGVMGVVGQIEVEAVRLDDFCASHGINRIDVLKMDVQGGEGLVLEGGARLLARRSIRLIYTELQFANIYDGQTSFDQFHANLIGAGYYLFAFYNPVYGPGTGLAWADAVYVTRENRDHA